MNCSNGYLTHSTQISASGSGVRAASRTFSKSPRAAKWWQHAVCLLCKSHSWSDTQTAKQAGSGNSTSLPILSCEQLWTVEGEISSRHQRAINKIQSKSVDSGWYYCNQYAASMESGVRKQANNNCDLACIFCVDDDQRSEEISLDTMRGAIHRITSPLLDHSRSKKGNILSSKLFQVFPSHTIYILLDGQMRRMQLGDKVEPSALFVLACCKESPCLYVCHS